MFLDSNNVNTIALIKTKNIESKHMIKLIKYN